MIKNIDFKTAFYKEDLFTKFKIKQDDTINFNIEIEDAPENLSLQKKARFLLRRADKTVIYEEVDITVDKKIVSFKAPSGSTVVAGTAYGELEFSDDETFKSSTFIFVFDVVAKVGRVEEAIETSDEIFIIKEIRDFINAIKEDLLNIKEDVIDLEARQEELDARMEEVFAKAEELIKEVADANVNIEDLKQENDRAETNIKELGDINATAEELKDDALKEMTDLRNEAVETITRLGDESMNNINNLSSNAKEEIKELKENALEEIRTGKTDAVSKINVVKEEALESVRRDIDKALTNLEVNIDEAIEEIATNKDNALTEINSAADAGYNKVQGAVAGNLEEITNLRDTVLTQIRNSKDNALEDIEDNTDSSLALIEQKCLDAINRISELDVSNIENINNAKDIALNIINTTKEDILREITTIRDEYLEDITSIEVDMNTTLEQAKNILEALKTENNNSLEWIQKVEDAITRAEASETELDNAVNIASDLASKLDSKQTEGELLNNKLIAAVENAKNKFDSLSGKIGEANELKPALEELLNSLEAVKIALEELNASSDEKINTFNELHPQADLRIQALRELIEEAKKYEVVVQQWIDTRAGDHTEIEARLLVLETAVVNIQDKLNALMTNNISGAIENVVITEWDTIEDTSIFDTLEVVENFKNVFVGQLGDKYECVVGFFNREVEGKTAVIDYSKADRRLDIIDFIAGDVIKMFGYTGEQWEELAGTQYINYFGGTENNKINKIYYHDFKIYDNHGAVLREKYGIETDQYTVNDFNNAIVLNNYRVSQKEGERLGNCPIDYAFNGILEVEITDNIIKQELTCEDGSVYKRISKLGSWFNWDKVLDGSEISTVMDSNVGIIGEGVHLVEAPTSVKDFELPNEFNNYPTPKHKMIFEKDTNTYGIIFFFCNLDREGGKYVNCDVISSTSLSGGYNTFKLNNMEVNKDYVYCTGTVSNGIKVYPGTELNAVIASKPSFRMCYYDFNIYDESANNIRFNPPEKDVITNFNDAIKNGFYTVDLDAGALALVENGPVLNGVGGQVKGHLEVVNGTQKLSLNSHGKIYTRETGNLWNEVSADKISAQPVGYIKEESNNTPEFLKQLPKNLFYFNNVDINTLIFKYNENKYCVLRVKGSNSKLKARWVGLNLELNTTKDYVQVDTYDALSEQWTTTYTNLNTGFTQYINGEYFKLYHSDITIYSDSYYSKVMYEPVKIEFGEHTVISDFNEAVKNGEYYVETKEEDQIKNKPSDVLRGILTVKNIEGVITQRLSDAENTVSYIRYRKDYMWTNWTEVDADTGSFITADEVNTKIEDANNKVDEKISEAIANMEGAQDGFIGSIGVSTKFATMPVGLLDDVPEAPEVAGGEYIGKIVFKYEYSSISGDKYKVLYLYNHQEKGYYPYLYLDTSSSEIIIKGVNISGSYTARGFERGISGGSWTESNSFPIFYEERKAYVFYYSDLPVYSDVNKTDIYRDASGASDYISNLDNANKAGKYYVKLSKTDYASIQNMPNVKLKEDLETVLYCYNKDGKILQEITIEGITYTRTINGLWTGIDTSNFIKKNVIANIEGSAVSTYNLVDNIFASCPVLNTHMDIVGEIDFKVDENKYCRVYLYKKSGNEMFYRYDSSSTVYIGSTAGRYYFARYIYTDGAWSQDTSTSTYISCKKAQFELYKNTLPICQGSNPTTFDKNIIIKEASSGDERTITDFNNATEFGTYNVNIEADTIASNSPIEGELKGILKCTVAKNKIYQLLKANTNDAYERVYNGSEWTEWKLTGEQADLSIYATNEYITENYYNKTEVSEKYYNKEEISEGYYDKTEVDKKFNKINNYKGEIGSNELLYVAKPEGFDEAFGTFIANEEYKTLWPTMNGNVIGYIQCDYKRMSGTSTVTGTQEKGVFLITDYNDYYTTLRPFIYNSTTEDRAYDILRFNYNTSSTMSGSIRNNMVYPFIFNTQTGAFEKGTQSSSSYHYAIYSFYYSTFNIYNADLSEVMYPSLSGDLVAKITDFNEATSEGNYKVVIEEGDEILNVPVEGATSGILKVVKADSFINQVYESNDNRTFKRTFNKEWSAWKEIGGGADTGDFITSSEVDNKISEAISGIDIPTIDLSNYHTKDETTELINALIGVPKTELISILNDIIKEV